MPTVKELNIQLENKPGTLSKLCNALAGRKVNIVAFQASTAERRSQLHLVVDNLAAAKTILDAEGLAHTENDVAQVTLPNRPGELARVAGKLGEANININYAYAGIEPNTNAPLLFFGVAEVGRAVQLLDQTTSAAASR
ncbi:MAG: amino acid-binding protein [Acidobacteria bacterium]|nr:MAG: amino acid-binding protein [Acidobacteriota bacterium]